MRYFTEIDEYCASKSTPVSKVCDEIEKYTVAHVPMSVMLVGPLEASFLGFLVSLTQAKRVLEIGCYTGYSALAMAERLCENGEFITIDMNPETSQIAQQFWKKSPHGSKIKLILGPALETVKSLKGPIDLVFLDATKTEYLDYLEWTLPLLSERGVIVADNCLREGAVLNPRVSDEGTRAIRRFNDFVAGRTDLESVLLPVRDGVFLIRKINSDSRIVRATGSRCQAFPAGKERPSP